MLECSCGKCVELQKKLDEYNSLQHIYVVNNLCNESYFFLNMDEALFFCSEMNKIANNEHDLHWMEAHKTSSAEELLEIMKGKEKDEEDFEAEV